LATNKETVVWLFIIGVLRGDCPIMPWQYNDRLNSRRSGPTLKVDALLIVAQGKQEKSLVMPKERRTVDAHSATVRVVYAKPLALVSDYCFSYAAHHSKL